MRRARSRAARHRRQRCWAPALLPTAAALLLSAAAALAPAAARASFRCEARVEIEPRRGYVGQAIEHRLVVVRAEGIEAEWAQPLRFPGFRSESVASGSARRVERAGVAAVEAVVPVMLFAVRPGALPLPAGHLRCGDHEVDVPSPTFEALPWPAAGRPRDFTGVVGSVAIDVASEASVALGSAVRVHVTSRGSANLWDAAPTLGVEPPDTEVFAREPSVTFHAGAAGLQATRHDAFDLVPRRAGALRVAPLRIAYLDPRDGRYHVAETPPLEIRVVEAGEPAALDPAVRAAPPGASAHGAATGAAVLVAALAAAALVLAAVAGLRLWRASGAPDDPLRAALRAFERAEDVDSRSAALEGALRLCLAEIDAAPPPAAAESGLELFPEAPADECRRALAELERARFGPSGPGVDMDARLAAVHALILRARRR